MALGRGDQGHSVEARGQRLSFGLGKRRTTEVKALLLLHEANQPAPQADMKDSVLTVHSPDWEDLLSVNSPSGRLSSDGRYVSVRKQAGKIVRWAAQDATRLTHDGEIVFRSTAKSSVASAAGKAVVESNGPTELEIAVAARPARCMADGHVIPFRFEERPRTLRVKIPGGTCVLAWS